MYRPVFVSVEHQYEIIYLCNSYNIILMQPIQESHNYANNWVQGLNFIWMYILHLSDSSMNQDKEV